MIKTRKLQLWMLYLLTGGAILSTIAQLELPFLVKEVALILPLQVAALGYVAWYWRDRKTP